VSNLSSSEFHDSKLIFSNYFSGTFITLDICISRLEDVASADIRGTVEKIRAQRAYSIQMPDQYVFCHLALIEYALAHKHLSPDINLDGFDDNDNSDSE
jgi:tyrosine-protein phosphatase non-receptor type 9